MSGSTYTAETIQTEILKWADENSRSRGLSAGSSNWSRMLLRLEEGDTPLHDLLVRIGNEMGSVYPTISDELLTELRSLSAPENPASSRQGPHQ